MTSPAPSDDETDGDLGLGDGLKPGALPNFSDDHPENDQIKCHENFNSSIVTSGFD